MIKSKVSVLGHFGNGLNLLNGQTVKTKIITEELIAELGREQVVEFDTHGGIKTLLKAPFQVIKALKISKNTVIFPAHNGLKVYAPLLAVAKSLFKDRKLHYVVIGGWLPEFLGDRKWLKKALEKFDGIYVETNTMKSALEMQGFKNVTVMPNCKKLNILTENELVYPEGVPYRLCTFSRVMKEKGIENAVTAVKAVNEELGYQAFSLDIYGQIDSNQTEWFDELQNSFPEYIRYGGLVPFDKSVEVLKNYFALLFPTYYEGEGFAGTLLDAYSAGVPVIATDWRYNAELVNESVGFVYPTGDMTRFVDILKNLAENPALIFKMKTRCIEEAEKYSIGVVVKILTDNLERE